MDTRCGSTVWGWRLCPDHGGVGREPPNPRRRRRRRRAGADTPGVRKPAARQARPCLLIHTEAGQLPVLLAPFVSGCRTAAALSTSRWKGRAVHLAAQGSQGRTPGPASRQPGDAGRRRGRDAARSDAAGRGLVGGRARRAPTGDPARVVRRIEWDAAWPALLGPTSLAVLGIGVLGAAAPRLGWRAPPDRWQPWCWGPVCWPTRSYGVQTRSPRDGERLSAATSERPHDSRMKR